MHRRQFVRSIGAFVVVRVAFAQFSSAVQVVNVFVTVRDKQGKLVRGLTKEDFKLTEDGKLQPIRYFSDQSDQPLILGLLFDLSGSQRAVIDQQRNASVAFLKQVLRSGDQALIVGFNRSVNLLQPLTGSQEQLAAGLAKLDVARGADGKLSADAQGTALFDAIEAASRALSAEPGRKAIVLLSDGIDTASDIPLNTAIEAAQRADTLLYPIRFYDRKVFAFDIDSPATAQLRAGKRALQKMAAETGGGFFELSDSATLESNFAAIEDELRHQYSLGFSPADSRVGYHKLRVTLNTNSKTRGLTVQARDGYYGANQ